MKNLQITYLTRKQQGFSIVELMVAVALSLVILAGILKLYSSNKSAFRSQESISRIQEGYRFASENIQKELRLAGYYGCNKESAIVNTLSANPFIADYLKPVEGFNATNTTTWDRSIAGTGLTIGNTDGDVVRGGTDILVIRRASKTQHPLTVAMTNINSSLQIQAAMSTAAFTANDVVIVSDCNRSAIFQVTGFNQSSGVIEHATSGGSIGNITTQLLTSAPAFNVDASVMKLDTIVFFIGTSANGTPSLKRKINNNASETIINGVENMQIVYGLDTDATLDGVANRYVNAANITAANWSSITSTRISLLMTSPDNSLSKADTTTYNLLDEAIADTGTTITHAGDLKFRQAVNMTVDIRNI